MGEDISTLGEKNATVAEYKEAYDAFLKKYGLKSRLVPAEGYEVSRNKAGFIKREA